MIPPFDKYTLQEKDRWIHMRAIEWFNWPTFVSQPIAPVLLTLLPWWTVLVALIFLSFIWQVIQQFFVNARLSHISCLFVIWLKWPAVICSSAYLFVHGRYGVGIVALLWPWLSSFASAPAVMGFTQLRFRRLLQTGTNPSGNSIGSAERALARQLGYLGGGTAGNN